MGNNQNFNNNNNKSYNMKNYKFESDRSLGGKFTKICDDMMKSRAWKELKPRQHGLYLMIKRKFTKYNDGGTNHDNLEMTYKEAKSWYGSPNTFAKDLDKLIEKGFIKVIRHGKTARLCNIYGLSSMWIKYGTKEFYIHPNELRHSLTAYGNRYKGSQIMNNKPK